MYHHKQLERTSSAVPAMLWSSLKNAKTSAYPKVALSLVVMYVAFTQYIHATSDENSWIVAILSRRDGHYSSSLSENVSRLNDWRHLNHRPAHNVSKLALLMEPRSLSLLAPLLLHMISVVPPDWPFLFLGSQDNINQLTSSKSISYQIQLGRLSVQPIPDQFSPLDKEGFERALTNFGSTTISHLEWSGCSSSASTP